MSLIKKIQTFAFQENLWPAGAKIVVAVSGGPDSVCLLDVLFRLSKTYSLELIIAHVNYGLRQKDSQRDEDFVKSLAQQYNLKFVVLRPSVKKNIASENRFRDLRYAFFEKVRKENDFELIAVGHTLDDQAETFLLRLIRGSGLKGLSAMLPKRDLIIRPLLNTPRLEVIRYLKSRRLSFCLDKTNRQLAFLRNKVRLILLPLLEKKFNPGIKKTLASSAQSIAADMAWLDSLTLKEWRRNPQLSIKHISRLQPALQRRLILQAIKSTRGSLMNISFGNLQEIFKLIKSQKSKNQTLVFRGLKVQRKGDKVLLARL